MSSHRLCSKTLILGRCKALLLSVFLVALLIIPAHQASAQALGSPCNQGTANQTGATFMDTSKTTVLACLFNPDTGHYTWQLSTHVKNCSGGENALQFDGMQFTCAPMAAHVDFPTCTAGQYLAYNGTNFVCVGSTPPQLPNNGACSCSTDSTCITTVITNDATALRTPTPQGAIVTYTNTDCQGNVTVSGPTNECYYSFQGPPQTFTCNQGDIVNICDSSGNNCHMGPCPVGP